MSVSEIIETRIGEIGSNWAIKNDFFQPFKSLSSEYVRTFALVLKFHNCALDILQNIIFLAHSFLIELILQFFPSLTKLFRLQLEYKWESCVILIHKLNSFESHHHRPWKQKIKREWALDARSSMFTEKIFTLWFSSKCELRPNKCQVDIQVKHVLIAGQEMTSNHEKCSRKINFRYFFNYKIHWTFRFQTNKDLSCFNMEKQKVWKSYLNGRRESFVNIFGTIASCNHQIISAFGFTI